MSTRCALLRLAGSGREHHVSMHLHGVGHFHPRNVIDNAFLEALDIGTTDAWIMERVGIRARRTVLDLDYIRHTRNADPRASVEASECNHAQMGARAARMALERAGLQTSDIGMVIAGGTAPDNVTPAESCSIAAALGIEAPAFDIVSACTSFFVPMHVLSMMDPARMPPYVLVVVPESLTCTVDYRERSAAVLWGDGAAAAVISTRVPGRAEILGTMMGSNPAGFDKVVVPRQGFFRQEGQAVQKFAIKTMTSMVKQLQSEQHARGRTLSFIGHQANLRMLEYVAKSCDIPPQRHLHNVTELGNTGAAGAPSVLSMHWDEFNASADVAMAGVGAGLTWSSLLLRFS
jgi:3-oxoacyl-[acyl-carrier-protein] synthase III